MLVLSRHFGENAIFTSFQEKSYILGNKLIIFLAELHEKIDTAHMFEHLILRERAIILS